MMRHRKIEELLAVYRSLDAGQRQVVDAHIQTCPSCAARLAAYEDMDRALFALPTPAPDRRLRSLVMDTLAGHTDMNSPDRRNRQLAPRVFPLVAAVALVLVLSIATVFMMRGFVRTPTVQPKVVRPVLVETPTAGSTPAVVQTVEVSANVVPAEIQAVVDEVLRHTVGSTGTGAAQTDFAATIRRFRQADDWAVVDVSYKYGYDEITSSNLLARQVIALQQTPDGVWRPSELVYMPELTLRTLWGSQKTLNLRHLDLVYYEFDEPFVRSALAASDLDAFVEGAASTLQAPLEANERLTLRIAPNRSALWEDEALMQVDGLSDLPLGDLVPTPTPDVFTPLVPLPSTSELSAVVGSTDLDVGLTVFSHLRRVAFLELARRIVGGTAQPMDGLPALVSQLAMWEAGPPAYPVGPDVSMSSWAQMPVQLRELPPLSELLAPGDTVDDSLLLQDMPYGKAMVFLAFLEERYGKQSFGLLVRALVSQGTWEGVVRTAFDEDPARFEAQWQEWPATVMPSVTPYATAAPADELPPPQDPLTATLLSGLVYRTFDKGNPTELQMFDQKGKLKFLSNEPYGVLSPNGESLLYYWGDGLRLVDVPCCFPSVGGAG